ncbi:MAG: Rpp14/Pop5 family protein [Candidatus Altiarchaeota archaeon]
MTKPTPPTLRERNRYIVIELSSKGRLAREDVVKSAWNTILRFLGEWHAGETGFNFMDWDAEKGRGIIRVNHKNVKPVHAALTLVKEAGKTPVRPRILGVAGTLKKARTKWM